MSFPPLHTQNPLGRFADRAEDYAKYRPTYPREAIDCILAGLPDPSCPPSQLIAADIGAGTGIAARLLADRGVTVWAIEPNPAMREAALPHPLIHFQDGTAEHTRLPDQSVGLILCAQSFHWFDPPIAFREFHRILKPGGRVALIWNIRDLTDEFTQNYSAIVAQVADRNIFDRKGDTATNPLASSPLFSNCQSQTFSQTYPLDQASLIGLALSTSYVPKQGAAYEQLIANLQTLYQRWVDRAGETAICLSYRVNLHLGDRHAQVDTSQRE